MRRSHTEQERRARERLELLFDANHEAVARYVWRRTRPDVVDDVVAETFLVAWRRLDDVPAESLPWLLGVARRVISTQRRSVERQHSLVRKLADSTPQSSDDPSAPGDTAVISALAQLSERDREAITLIAWEGLTPAQAAAVLRIPRASFRARLSRAKRRLRQQLDEDARALSSLHPNRAFP